MMDSWIPLNGSDDFLIRSEGARVRIRVIINIHTGYGTDVRTYTPGDYADLPIVEATVWCLRGWAEPVF